MQLAIAFEKLAEPRNQRAAVLKLLLERQSVSEQETSMNAFRTRISDLKREPYNVNIRTIKVKFTTTLGKPSHYNKHFLLEGEKPMYRELYERINK